MIAMSSLDERNIAAAGIVAAIERRGLRRWSSCIRDESQEDLIIHTPLLIR